MNTKALRQKILDLAIHGKLVPQDPNDEPASVLLERIRAEKERLIKEGKIKRPKKTKATSDKPHYPYELPEGWVWTTLGEISNYGTTINIQVDDIDKNEWILELEDIEKETANIIQRLSASERSVKGTRHKFSAGSILYSKLRTYLNKVLVAPSEGYCTTEIMPFDTYGIISNEYICHVLRSPFFLDYTLQCGYGVKMPRLSTTDACNGMIPLPPLNEQIRIVEAIKYWFVLIDIIESGKENLQETIKQAKSKILDLAIHGKLVPQDPTDEPASELLKRINPKAEITSDNGHYQKLPEGWAILKVGDVAEYINGRAFKPEEWEQTGLPIIRIQNLNDPNAYYNRTKNEYEEKYLIKKGDLLFAWAASLGTYIWKGEDAWLNQHIFKVVPYPFMDKKYLYYAFHAMITEFYRKSHGSGMIHITRKQFEEITLWLPPLAEQYRIVQYLQQVFEKLDSIVENL
ncbi:type I restriction endonuclease [Prevotella sp. P5-108]|uniref:restriction endonuclease subunit S n=1 Tax=Prevotella sp. P5-108 TaxID=2024225 RepID=UPI000B95E9C5|nr:restriction endonuclease subunit S [Prevotella sp. P5-108]OYP63283.1 type I restriction endonuclease [Prevotella sp. P5-108]